MKSLKILVLSLSMAAILTWPGCKEEPPCNDPSNPDCANYDPCYGKKPVTADFEMSEVWRFVPPDYYLDEWNPDVAFRRSKIGFKPIGYDEKDTSVKYTWLLGAEVIHEFYFERDFMDTKEKEIPVTLIVEKQADISCFPQDDGKDTLTKVIKLLDSYCETLTNGDFKVLFEGEKDSTIIKIRYWSQHAAGYIKDTCTGSARFIGFNRDSIQPDTNWVGVSQGIFNSKIIFYPVVEGGGGVKDGIRGGYFIVDPKTLECKAEYQFYLGGIGEGTKYSRKFKCKGRKIR
jgi:hypothetical protein